MRIEKDKFLSEWKANKHIMAEFTGINTSGQYCINFKIFLPSAIWRFRFKPKSDLEKSEIKVKKYIEYNDNIDLDFVEI